MASSAKVYLAEYINLHEALYYCTVPCDATVCSTGLPLVCLQRVAKGSARESLKKFSLAPMKIAGMQDTSIWQMT